MTSESFHYDEILEQINPRGRYQFRLAALLWLVTASAGIGVVAFAFTAFRPAQRCIVPSCEKINSTSYSAESSLPNFYSIGYEDALSAKMAGESCQRPKLEQSSPLVTSESLSCDEYTSILRRDHKEVEQETCSREELIFDDSIVESSITIDFNFLCKEKFLHNIFNALYMCGMLLGSIVLGLISDHFGRKKALLLAIALLSWSGVVSAFVKARWIFAILRIMTGMGGMGCFMIPFVMVLENTTPKYVILLSNSVGIGFIFGELILALEAYFIRTWVTLQLVAYGTMSIVLLLAFIVPESTRWLIAQKRFEEAKIEISKMAKMNGRPEPDYSKAKDFSMATELKVIKANPRDLFRPKVLAKRSVNMLFQWFSVTLCYYGITFSTTSLAGDPYVNFAISAALEIPSIILGYFIIDRMGRRFVLSACQAISGIACVAAGVLGLYPHLLTLQICLVMLGKFCATLTFGTVYLYTSELFPTGIRSTAVGTCSMVARVGGIISLLLGATKSIWLPLPMVIMGTVAIVAGILASAFPETTGQELPMTMGDALHIGKDSKFRLCSCSNTNH